MSEVVEDPEKTIEAFQALLEAPRPLSDALSLKIKAWQRGEAEAPSPEEVQAASQELDASMSSISDMSPSATLALIATGVLSPDYQSKD